MVRKILVTGGSGMLATDFVREAEAWGFDVVSMSRADLDVTCHDQIKAGLDSFKPNYVFHTVGLLVDQCQAAPAEAYRVHVWATGCLARHCQRIGATLVNVSTCGLFGDERRFYSEYDPVTLKTFYARSKYLAEQAASDHCERTFNIRPGWLYGGTHGHKKNFVYQRYLEAKRSSVMKSAGDKFGCPTWTVDLSRKILELLETGEYGLYHVTNQGGCSRYEYVRNIVNNFGLSTSVEEVDSSFFPRRSAVPASEMLENSNLKFLGLQLLRPWQDAVQEYISVLRRAVQA